LANIFYRLNYVESYGTGIGRMLDIYEQFNLKPSFTVTDNAFKVTLPNVNYKNKKKRIGIF
jgi:ATP-dependent DNA helicase RecG